MIEYHGPRFAAWVKTQDPNWAVTLSEENKRRLRDYVNGVPVTERIADRICCEINQHLKFIPARCRLPEVDRFTRSLILRDLKNGYWPHEIARLLEISPAIVKDFA